MSPWELIRHYSSLLMNHCVENRNNQWSRWGQKSVLDLVQTLTIKEHELSALNSKQGIQFHIPWSTSLNRFGLDMGQGTLCSWWINVESREKQWLHSVKEKLWHIYCPCIPLNSCACFTPSAHTNSADYLKFSHHAPRIFTTPPSKGYLRSFYLSLPKRQIWFLNRR